ncbi:MAG: hypothetical protein RIT37_898 [Bacteroidota bacterium]
MIAQKQKLSFFCSILVGESGGCLKSSAIAFDRGGKPLSNV